MTPFAVLPVGNMLAEGIQWNAADQAFWWTDIQSRRLYRHHLVSGDTMSFATPERLCCFAFVEGDRQLMAAFESGIGYFDMASGAVEWLHRPEQGETGRRFNDGGVDRQGRFWAGTMCETAPHGSAALYRLDAAGTLTRQIKGVAIANGACWSVDGLRFHFTDSPTQTIVGYDLDPVTGDLSNPMPFATTTGDAYPDGATIDAEDHVWSAHWGAGRVVRYRPDGSIERTLDLPVTQPTCCAFGGPDLDIFAVTTARDGLSDGALVAQPLAGHVFLFRCGIQGLEEPRYRRGGLTQRARLRTGCSMKTNLGRSFTYDIVQHLGQEIVTGVYGAQNPFPIEAELCKRLGASRSVLREAVKMLTTKGLLNARPRQGTWVEPESNWNLLDPDVLRWLLERKFSPVLLLEFSQVRLAIEPMAAALAARHADAPAKAAIMAALDRMRAADLGEDDPLESDIAFHVAILRASGNRFLSQLRDLIDAALRTSIRLTNRRKGVRLASIADHQKVADAILAADADGARLAMRDLMLEAMVLIEKEVADSEAQHAADAATQVSA